MPRRSHLTFQEADGHVRVEVLGLGADFADLVNPDDGSVVHEGPFAMHGGEWQIESVTVTEDLIRISCTSTEARVQVKPLNPGSRSSIRR